MAEAPTNKGLNVAVFGYGKMGQHHKTAIALSGIANVVAVSDPMISNELKTSLHNDGVACYDDPGSLLKEARPDVVHVCTPPGTHAGLALQALDAGCHVYVEKPFAPTLDEARSILDRAGSLEKKVCAGHQVLYEETARRLPAMMRVIGRLTHVESFFSFRQVRRNLTPTEQLIDILPHPVYLLYEILDRYGQEEALRVFDPVVDPAGEVRCLVKRGQLTGMIHVTLRGRPVESYLKVIGENGTIIADFVRNIAIQLPGPGASAFDAVINPYWYSKQLAGKTTKAFFKRALRKQKSYPGLYELTSAFHRSIVEDRPSPVSSSSILETVDTCEKIGRNLMAAHQSRQAAIKQRMESHHNAESIPEKHRKKILVTGGTGFLGKEIVQQLAARSRSVRVLSRGMPLYENRIPGVEYFQCDVSGDIPEEILDGIDTVIHCAAETAGGREAHQRNSIDATRNLIRRSHEQGIREFVFVSSIAVLKSSKKTGGPLTETSPVDYGNPGRGPYVWGKAESEMACRDLSEELNMDIKIVRPGPLVDFRNFAPPGRLGRRIGPIFVAVGPRRSRLAVCDVTKAAQIINSYVSSFEEMPSVLNLLNPEVPRRSHLVNRLLEQSPYISVFWMPGFVVSFLSPLLVVLQKLVMKKKDPIRVADAFASEDYDTTLVRSVYTQTSGNALAAQ